jgi:hypothetical protein
MIHGLIMHLDTQEGFRIYIWINLTLSQSRVLCAYVSWHLRSLYLFFGFSASSIKSKARYGKKSYFLFKKAYCFFLNSLRILFNKHKLWTSPLLSVRKHVLRRISLWISFKSEHKDACSKNETTQLSVCCRHLVSKQLLPSNWNRGIVSFQCIWTGRLCLVWSWQEPFT